MCFSDCENEALYRFPNTSEVEREDDPLPMRMYGWSTRSALAERGELVAWFKRNTRLARDGKRPKHG